MAKKIMIIVFFGGILLIPLLFIWGNSYMPGYLSANLSYSIETAFRPLLAKIIPDQIWNYLAFRKAAHFLEFFCLGGFLFIFMIVIGDVKLQSIVNILSFGLLTAVVDETIQTFSYGRTTQITDVWIDFAGSITGALCFLVIYGVLKVISIFVIAVYNSLFPKKNKNQSGGITKI